MPWPTPQEYNEAIQTPALCFADDELRTGTLNLSVLGLPQPITGNFASVYRVRCGQRTWAVKCFWREYEDLPRRYAAISARLRDRPLPSTVDFVYLTRGIRVRGRWYPILKMEWAQGIPLDQYVAEHLDDAPRLAELSKRWLTLVASWEQAGVAHGDLQHGNVLVEGHDFKVVDYDGMYVPLLAGSPGHEAGHPNYQHPRRTDSDFGPALDRFAAWGIYVSLVALCLDPTLWDRTAAGDDCLLFRRRDFEHPVTSTAFALLEQHADERIRILAGHLRGTLDAEPRDIPPLNGFPDLRVAAHPARRRRQVRRLTPSMARKRRSWKSAIPRRPRDLLFAAGYTGVLTGVAWAVVVLSVLPDPSGSGLVGPLALVATGSAILLGPSLHHLPRLVSALALLVRRRWYVGAGALALLLAGGASAAAIVPRVQTVQTAAAEYKQGQQLLTQGDVPGALASLTAAQRRSKGYAGRAVGALWSAETHAEQAGRRARALSLLASLVSLAGEDGLTNDAARASRMLAAQEQAEYALAPGTRGGQTWSQDRADAGHSGYAPFGGLSSPGSGVLVETVYVSTMDGTVTALDARTGQERWRATTPQESALTAPAIADGTVYVGSCNHHVYALSAQTGQIEWTASAGSGCVLSTAVQDGEIYVTAGDRVTALDARTGQPRWHFTAGGLDVAGQDLLAGPVLGHGLVYVIAGPALFALDAQTGHLVWSVPVLDNITLLYQDNPTIVIAGATVYVQSVKYLTALNAATGHIEWRTPAWQPRAAAPAVAGDVVYESNNDGLSALDARTGKQRWRFQPGETLQYDDNFASPSVVNGTVYAALDNNLYALDGQTGRLIWSVQGDDPEAAAPAVANGAVYVSFGRFFALDARTGARVWSSNDVNATQQPSVPAIVGL